MLSASHAYSQTQTSVPKIFKLNRASWKGKKTCPISSSKSLEE